MRVSIVNLAREINKLCDDLEFIQAKRLIELNIDVLKEAKNNKHFNANSKELIRHVLDFERMVKDKGLTRVEMLTLERINQYCRDFDISMLKRLLRDSLELLQREEAQSFLTDNAKYLLESMGAILVGRKIDFKEKEK